MKLMSIIMMLGGIISLFFPGLIIFGYGISHWMDVVTIIFLISLSVILIWVGASLWKD